jgi:HSP20 family protein
MRSLIHYTNPGSSLLPSFGFADRPWARLDTDIDRWFESALAGLATPVFDNHFAVDVYEDKDNTYVRAELPGVDRNDIKVEMVEGYLSISANRKAMNAEGKGEGSFSVSRSISVPDNVQADKVGAAYENGVLTVTLPKQEEAKPRTITVSVK